MPEPLTRFEKHILLVILSNASNDQIGADVKLLVARKLLASIRRRQLY
jgi:hypothetical protein